MKKIGIITIHNSPNYGACLQAFALYEYIRQQGFDVELIDLHRPHYEDYKPSKHYISYIDSNLKKTDILKRFIKRVLFKKGRKLIKPTFYNPVSKKKFNDFNSQIKLSRPYLGIDDLYANPPIYDIYITGSDQLWNPTQPFCIEPYFLTFAPKNAIKISYAASIGVTELSKQERDDFKSWLSSYNAISVREKQAQELLSTLVNSKIDCVADPTFLLNASEWKQMMISPNINKPYILLFTLRHEPQLHEYALRLSHESGFDLIILNQVLPQNLSGNFIAVRDAGPKEWLGYIEQAEMVITNSFHGTVFSLILGTKNFFTHIDTKNKRGSRIINLLETYQLTNHILTEDLTLAYSTLIQNTINRDYISTIMNKEQSLSKNYLNQFLTK